MADVLETASGKASKPSGLRTPAQLKTVAGPGVRVDGKVSSIKQTSLKIGGGK